MFAYRRVRFPLKHQQYRARTAEPQIGVKAIPKIYIHTNLLYHPHIWHQISTYHMTLYEVTSIHISYIVSLKKIGFSKLSERLRVTKSTSLNFFYPQWRSCYPAYLKIEPPRDPKPHRPAPGGATAPGQRGKADGLGMFNSPRNGGNMGNIHVTMVGKFPAHQPFTWNHMDNGGKMQGKLGNIHYSG